MSDKPRTTQDRVDSLFRLAGEIDQVAMVLADAERGLEDPSSLTELEIQRICFALVAAHASRSER